MEKNKRKKTINKELQAPVLRIRNSNGQHSFRNADLLSVGTICHIRCS
jgi:hypothetical protein